MSYYDPVFNNNIITQLPGVQVLKIDPYLPAKRNLVSNALARSSKKKMASSFYNDKQITIRIGISAASRAVVEATLDDVLQLLQEQEKWLVVPQSGILRQYLCTYADYDVNQEGGAYMEFDLHFDCADMFGYDTYPTQLLQITNFSSSQKTDLITLDGSAPWQIPQIIYTFTSITGGTAATVKVGNASNGQEVQINRTWSSGDVLTIGNQLTSSGFVQTVNVNGTEVDFTGSIPEWSFGTGYIYYQDGFTARNFNALMTYQRRWV